jgi:hypothetical protein
MTEEQQERFFARVRAVASEDLRRKIDREDEELMAEMREQVVRATRAARERPAPDGAPT